MAEHVTVFQTSSADTETAPEMVDKALQECVMQSRPVYVELPSDMVDAWLSGLAVIGRRPRPPHLWRRA